MTNLVSRLILDATHDGKDVFTKYLGEDVTLGKSGHQVLWSNPFRDDEHPSCWLYPPEKSHLNPPQWKMMDFGDNGFQNVSCFQLVAKLNGKSCHGKDFTDVCHIINDDLCLNIPYFDRKKDDNKAHKSSNALQRKHKIVYGADVSSQRKSSPVVGFKLHTVPFSESDKAFWGQYGITEDVLKKYNVVSLERVHFYRKDKTEYQSFRYKGEHMFGYILNGGKGLKIYQPEKGRTGNPEKDKKEGAFRFTNYGDRGNPYVFGYEQLDKTGDKVFITGGEKDVMSLASHGFNAIAFNSEGSGWSDKIIKDLSFRFKDICVLFDNDKTGRTNSKEITKKLWNDYNIHDIPLPISGIKGKNMYTDKDISDFFRDGRTPNELNSIVDNVIKTDNERRANEHKENQNRVTYIKL